MALHIPRFVDTDTGKVTENAYGKLEKLLTTWRPGDYIEFRFYVYETAEKCRRGHAHNKQEFWYIKNLINHLKTVKPTCRRYDDGQSEFFDKFENTTLIDMIKVAEDWLVNGANISWLKGATHIDLDRQEDLPGSKKCQT